ncbi:MAG: hypothetical protein FJ202_06015 [Gemmatimonadetes bacterium]|nr:hypothetical protein [Gemmatimonadota bacterium]
MSAAAGLLALGGCGDDPFAPRADQPNVSQSFSAFAISGTATNAPAALNLLNKGITRIDGSFDFDIAFDINKAGLPVLMPLATVGTPISGARQIGLQRQSSTYENTTEAPKSGYALDSMMVVTPGQVVVVQSQQSICGFSIAPYTFAKIVIDSVVLSSRQLYGRTLINLNCGLRSLSPGTPKF